MRVVTEAVSITTFVVIIPAQCKPFFRRFTYESAKIMA